MGNNIITHRPVSQGKRGRFESLTPELDREQEAWETILAYAHSQVTRLERQRWEARRAAEEAAAYGVELAALVEEWSQVEASVRPEGSVAR